MSRILMPGILELIIIARSLIVAAQNSAWDMHFGKKAYFKRLNMHMVLLNIVFLHTRLRTNI